MIKELGHWEMDTVISRKGSNGGLLVMLDRCSRRYVIEHINHINQDEVITAIKRMKRRKALRIVRSVTTDNTLYQLPSTNYQLPSTNYQLPTPPTGPYCGIDLFLV